ncbi:MAG: PQQ-dependent sugar dehydrogenase [Promethearchaeota archaeon]
MKKKIVLGFLITITVTMGFTFVFLLNSPVKNNYDLQVAFPNLTFSRPVGIYNAGDGTNRLFVVEQDGIIKVFENNENVSDYQVFLDISTNTSKENEQGLLGFAFHPNYEINGYFYVYYIDLITENSIISRFKVNSSDMNRGNRSSEVKILTINQPYVNHNGGQIQFGPDGYLYIALGDGGGSGDPSGHGQNRQTLLGSILRVDIDSEFPYSIPIDNPFYGNLNGWAEEIFAFGFRNPWRFSFDVHTGFLWVADVGQSAWEEIDIVEKGKNYGWNTREGSHDFNPGSNVTNLEDPIYEYSHIYGRSITGGFVYRGSNLSSLIGKYIYADFITGIIWALNYSEGFFIDNTILLNTDLYISSFGVDSNNELLICAFDGSIYKIVEI